MARKVFLVDDEQINNKINKKVCQTVEPAGEYLDYADPRIAYDAISTMQPDLIFLDLNMPYMSGWDFLDKMTGQGLLNQVIILTSSVSNADRTRAATYHNVIEFMSKPVSKTLLEKYL